VNPRESESIPVPVLEAAAPTERWTVYCVHCALPTLLCWNWDFSGWFPNEGSLGTHHTTMLMQQQMQFQRKTNKGHEISLGGNSVQKIPKLLLSTPG